MVGRTSETLLWELLLLVTNLTQVLRLLTPTGILDCGQAERISGFVRGMPACRHSFKPWEIHSLPSDSAKPVEEIHEQTNQTASPDSDRPSRPDPFNTGPSSRHVPESKFRIGNVVSRRPAQHCAGIDRHAWLDRLDWNDSSIHDPVQ